MTNTARQLNVFPRAIGGSRKLLLPVNGPFFAQIDQR